MQTVAEIAAKLEDGLPVPATPAGSGAGQQLIYAATEEPFAFIPHANTHEIDDAVARARERFASGPWRRMTPAERGAILSRLADAILADSERLAIMHTLETGIPIREARGMHIPRTAENFRFFGELANSLSGETYEQTGRYLSVVTREPVGVGLVISPWNAPLVLASMKLAAGLALGNAMIVKPSEYAPLTALRLAELALAAGVPDGVVQVLCGDGPGTGQALVEHPGVDAIGFIGGTATGRRIMASAAGRVKKIGLELGGKSANIVLASADFERAVDGALMAIFMGNGEQCLAGSRILIEEGIADRFIDAFVARAKGLRVGDPFDAATEIGPLAFAGHYRRVLDCAEVARGAGYRLLCGGSRAEGFDRGYFFAPTVVEAEDNASDLCQQEIFGPFAVIQRVRNLDDAIARANATDYGLAAYLWSDDLASVMRARRELRAGTIWVNTPMARDVRAPFGGFNQSGLGRDGLPGSIDLFTEEKTTMIPQEPLTLPKLGLA